MTVDMRRLQRHAQRRAKLMLPRVIPGERMRLAAPRDQLRRLPPPRQILVVQALHLHQVLFHQPADHDKPLSHRQELIRQPRHQATPASALRHTSSTRTAHSHGECQIKHLRISRHARIAHTPSVAVATRAIRSIRQHDSTPTATGKHTP